MIREIASLVAALLIVAPAAARAQARVLQFRSAEDPNSPPDPAVCAQAPFFINARIGGSLYTYETRRETGEVDTEDGERIGKATACVGLTNFLFPEGLQQDFFLQLTLPEGVYQAQGTCTVISNSIPLAGLILAGCNLHLVKAPGRVMGGAVTSLSTFNPFRRRGFATGSYWTMQIYDRDGGPERREDSERAMEWTEGGDDGSRN